MLDQGAEDAAALVGLGVPLDAENEPAPGRFERLGQVVEHRMAGDLEAIPDRSHALMVMRFGAMELLARRPKSKIPTMGQWLGYLMRPRIGRVLVLLAWWWLGWHYFAR